MKKMWLFVCLMVCLFTMPVLGQEMSSEDQEIEEALNKVFPAESVLVKVKFRVLQAKQTVGFHLIGSEKKGFQRRLTRVTAELLSIDEIGQNYKYRDLVKEFIEKNAREIDLAVRYRSNFANGYFSSGANWTNKHVADFLDEHKKNRQATFNGYIMVDIFSKEAGAVEIRRVKLNAGVTPEKK